jgi:hypothetical protein
MQETVGMAEAIGRYDAFDTRVSLVQESFRVTFYMYNSVIPDTDQKGTSAMVHAGTVGFHPA